MNGPLSSIRRVRAIAQNTIMEALRNRAFVGLAIAAVGLVVSSMALSGLAVRDQMSRVLVDFGLFSIGLLVVLIAVTMGVILIYKEVDRKTFYVVLTKPVRRTEVLAGKFFGLMVVIAVAQIFMVVAWLGALVLRDVQIPSGVPQVLILVYFQAAVVTSIALFFSAFASPVLSGVFTFGTYIVGSSLYILEELLAAKKGMLVTNDIARSVAQSAVAVFPDLSVFNLGKHLILDVPIGWDYVGQAGLYGLGYCVFFWALASLVFMRRDFT